MPAQPSSVLSLASASMPPGAEPVASPRYRADELEAFAAFYEANGYVVLPELFPVEAMRAWRKAFEPLFQEKVAMPNGAGQRGPGRYYVTLPFVTPFDDPGIYLNPDVQGVLERILGPDFVMTQLATDTPVEGSRDQRFHSDVPATLERNVQLAVNFPLVDVTEENGPMEIAPGTHALPIGEAKAAIEAGRIPVLRVLMKAGDVMVRNVRTIHRGTANRSGTPRPMVVLGYNPEWHRRPEVSIVIPRRCFDALSPKAKRLLRTSVRAAAPELQSAAPEVYQSFAYGEFDLEPSRS